MKYKSNKYGSLTLSDEIDTGGEGTVYQVKDHEQLAIKLYNPAHRNATTEKKIAAMAKMNVQLSLPVRGQKCQKYFTSWPLDSLYDEKNQFCGFVMPRFTNTHSIICACRKEERSTIIKNYRYPYSIILAMNLANEVAYLHSRGIVVGDLNYKNIGFTDKLEVVLFDADSFTFTAKDGTEYKTRGGFEGLIPPELLGRDLSLDSSRFTKETDNFALAVLIFCLLMDNYHPFVNRGFNHSGPSSSCPSVDSNISRGICPCLKDREDLMPQGCPIFKKRIFVEIVRKGFENTFCYDGSNALKPETIAKRTTSGQWVRLMELFLKACKKQKEPAETVTRPKTEKISTITQTQYSGQKQATVQTVKTPLYQSNKNNWKTAFEQAVDTLATYGEFLIASLVLLTGFDLLSREALLIPMLTDFGLLHELDFFLEMKLILIAAAHGSPIAWLLDRLETPTGWMLLIWMAVLIICFFFAIHHYALW